MGRLFIVGLGPAGLDRITAAARAVLDDPAVRVIARTGRHPAVSELRERRPVETADDLYESAGDFAAVYEAIARRVVEAASAGAVVYAVPGSASVGEKSVVLIRRAAVERGIPVTVHPGESFLGLLFDRVELDPIERGLQVLDGRDLPDPLPLHLPTVVTQVDRPEVLADVAVELGKVLSDDVVVTVLESLGDAGESVTRLPLREIHGVVPGPRTTLYLDPPPVGWHGLVVTNRRLRRDCPWDRAQTHHTLVRHLVEEAFETVEAIAALPAESPRGEADFTAYAEVEEELGDLLLQVVFHATLAREAGAFDVEEVAEQIRRKLVRRHPHVFGDVEVEGAEHVVANWERLKAEEKPRRSAMDGIPSSLPALARADAIQRRAASVGFDWADVGPVVEKLEEEVGELAAVLADPGRSRDELGDVLFAVVNVSRHLGADPEVGLRRACDRFIDRFRTMEDMGPLDGLSLDELDARWDRAKNAEQREQH